MIIIILLCYTGEYHNTTVSKQWYSPCIKTGLIYKSRFEYSIHKAYAFFDSGFPNNKSYLAFLPFAIAGAYIDSFTKEFGLKKIKK